jgi:NAD-dependent deacetylase
VRLIPRDTPIVVLTGAGISRESGLATFRDTDGIWATVRIEDVATPEAFAQDPGRVHAFYNARRRQIMDPAVEPNEAHHALARLTHDWQGGVTVVTQNVDDLHDRAGTANLIHMHGELTKARCVFCDGVMPWREDLSVETPCPSCGRAGGMRPHVVWFGEMPLAMEEIGAALDRCGLFVSIGTSGAVYPAAGFVAQVRGRAHTVELNLEPTDGRHLFSEAIYGPATQVVPAFVARLMG